MALFIYKKNMKLERAICFFLYINKAIFQGHNVILVDILLVSLSVIIESICLCKIVLPPLSVLGKCAVLYSPDWARRLVSDYGDRRSAKL